jgi:hypothetical protein
LPKSDGARAKGKGYEAAKATTSMDEIDDSVLEEGSYYLSKLDLDVAAIAERFEIPPAQVLKHRTRFEGKLKRGEVIEVDEDLAFWRNVKQEAEGNVKATFVTDKGFHHAWRSDLEKLDGPSLLAIFESCKRFLNLDPNARFLEYAPPKNYDPLAMQREITKAVTVINSILESKWKDKGDSKAQKR